MTTIILAFLTSTPISLIHEVYSFSVFFKKQTPSPQTFLKLLKKFLSRQDGNTFCDPGAGHLTTVDINFLIYKMGITIPVLLTKRINRDFL